MFIFNRILMNTFKKISFFSITAIVCLGLAASHAEAVTPTLSITQTNNNLVSVRVYGQPNMEVSLNYYVYNSQNSTSILESTGTVGLTDNNGYLSTTIDSNNYLIPSGSTVYAVVNQQQTSSVVWPKYTNNNYNNYYYYPNLESSLEVYVPARAIPNQAQVYLSEIPYTGTGIGSTIKIGLFVLGLAAWTGGLAFFLVRRKALALQK